MVEQSLLNERDVSSPYLTSKSLQSGRSLKLPISFHWFGAVRGTIDALTIFALAIGANKIGGLWTYKDLPDGRVSTIVGLIAALLFLLLMQSRRFYEAANVLRRRRTSVVLQVWLIVIVAIVMLGFFTGLPGDHSRGATICFFAAGAVVLPTTSALAEWAFDSLIESDLLEARRKVVVFGELTSAHASRVLKRLEKYGYDVVGRIEPTVSDVNPSDADIAGLFGFVKNKPVDEILLVFKATSRGSIRGISQKLQELPIPVRLLLDEHIDWLLTMPICDLGAVKSVNLQGGSMDLPARFAKRSFDLLVASFGLVLLAPLFLAVGLAIRMESRGPVIFRQRRAGFSGRMFNIYKFRSMTSLDDGVNIVQATRNDSRVTRVGRLIRRTSIDELPQLVNVIRGEMSIVGPRPHALAHDDQYTQLIKSYARRHHMKPGLTGWAQVNGCRGETPHLAAMEMRVRYDIWYIKHWSLMLDVLAVAKTLWHVAFPRNVY